MNIKLSIALLFLVCISNAQPQILDKVVAIVGKNPLLLSEIETNLIQQKEKKELAEITQGSMQSHLKIYCFKNYY
jgi:hypothetical protein